MCVCVPNKTYCIFLDFDWTEPREKHLRRTHHQLATITTTIPAKIPITSKE